MRIRYLFRFALSVAILCPTLHAHGQFSPAASAESATTIPAAQLIQPADLKTMLASKDTRNIPLVLQVGSRVFFAEAHIPHAQYAGPGSQPAGLKLLESAVSSLPKDKFIVIYCGCCPWNRCPNVGPAFQRLHGLGYTNVKVLYLAHDFGEDWVSKGFPSEK